MLLSRFQLSMKAEKPTPAAITYCNTSLVRGQMGRPRLSPERHKRTLSVRVKPAALDMMDKTIEAFPERFSSKSEFVEQAIVHWCNSLYRRKKLPPK